MKFEFETFGWVSPDEHPDYRAMSWYPREDDYASVAFWYQTGIPTFETRAPHARERKLPNIERSTILVAGLDLGQSRIAPDAVLPRLEYTGRMIHTGVEKQVMRFPEHFEHDVLFVPASSDVDTWIQIPFDVSAKEPLRLLIAMGVGPDLGIYEVSLDGVKLGVPMDFYSPSLARREFHFLDFWPEPGTYVLRLECAGKNHLSSGYGMIFESVRLRERRPRVKEMAHDRDKDWRIQPLYYEGV